MTDDDYTEALIDFVLLLEANGAKTIWDDLKASYPKAYFQLLMEALNQVKK